MTPNFKWLRRLVFGLSFILICLSFIGGVLGYSPVPYWDMWDGAVNFILRFDDAPSDRLFAQHNEHRLVLARLFFLIEFRVFGGSGVFLAVCNYLFVFVSWGIFARGLYRLNAHDTHPRDIYVLIAILGAWLFLWVQRVNFTWAFQSQFFLAQLLPLIAFLLLSHAAFQSRTWNRSLLGAILMGVISALSMANGAFALPLMTLWAIVLRMKKQQVLLLAVAAFVTLWLYLSDYTHPSTHGSLISTFLTHPAESLIYTFRYLGNPGIHLAGSSTLIKTVSMLAGFCLSAFTAYAVVRAIMKRPSEPTSAGLLLFIVYVGASAFATAGGRLLFGLDSAFSSRYTTPTLMAWAALFCILSPWMLTYFRSSERAKLTLLSSAVLALCLLMVSQVRALKPQHDLNHQKALAVLALEMGIGDDAPISIIYPNTRHVLNIAKRASDEDLGIFGSPRIRGVREQIGQVAPPKETRTCAGQLDRFEIIDDQAEFVRVYGWQFDSRRKSNVSALHFVDENGVIVGAAIFGAASPSITEAYGPAARRAGFSGYLRTQALGQVVSVVSGACRSKNQL